MSDDLELVDPKAKREAREERRGTKVADLEHYSLSRARSSRMNIANNSKFDRSKSQYDYRWVNTADDGKWTNNVADCQSIGFVPVRRSDIGLEDVAGSPGIENSERPGDIIRKSVGSGVDAILMRRPIEYKERSQREKHDEIDRMEADINRNLRRGSHENTADEKFHGRDTNVITRS